MKMDEIILRDLSSKVTIVDRDERDEQNLIARRNFAAAAMREQQLQQQHQHHLTDQVRVRCGMHL